MKILLDTRDIDFNKTVLYWDVEPNFKEDINLYRYIVEVSESELGPWLVVNNEPIDAFGYIDTQTIRGMVDQRIYYRVRAIGPNGAEFDSNIISLTDEATNYLSRYISRQEQLVLNRYNGQDCLHYSRRKFGNRCPNCYDFQMRKAIMSKCPVCYGTTYEGGYFVPVKIRVNLDPKAKQIDKNEHGVTESKNLSGWTSNLSIIEPDDLLIFLRKTSERYVVAGVNPTSIGNATIKQMLNLVQLDADRVEQLIHVDYNAYSINEVSAFRRNQVR